MATDDPRPAACAQDDLLVLGVRTLARLAGVPKCRVRRAMDAGRLVTVTTDRLRGRTCRYVVVRGTAETPTGPRDGAAALDAWLATQRDRLPLDEAETPRTNGGFPWFFPVDVRSAREAGRLPFRGDTVLDVGAWLRWAAAWMPEGERRAILGEPA